MLNDTVVMPVTKPLSGGCSQGSAADTGGLEWGLLWQTSGGLKRSVGDAAGQVLLTMDR